MSGELREQEVVDEILVTRYFGVSTGDTAGVAKVSAPASRAPLLGGPSFLKTAHHPPVVQKVGLLSKGQAEMEPQLPFGPQGRTSGPHFSQLGAADGAVKTAVA